MAKPMLVPFRAEHLSAFIHRDMDYVESVESALQKERCGPAFTAIIDDRVIGCSGIILGWPGLGVAWAVFSHEIMLRFPLWATRTIRAVLQDTIRIYKLHRVELVVLKNHKQSERWAEALGFDRENGCARSYTTKRSDVIRYELVR